MYGTRARIGAIVPSVNVCAEPDLARIAPTGVSIHCTRLALATARHGDVRGMSEAALDAAALIADLEPDFALFNCTAAAALAEPGLAARIEAVTGCPAGTTADAIVAALAACGARRIALVSPYPPELAEPEERFFAERGIEVGAHVALAIEDVREWPRIEPRRWVELAVEAQAEAEAEAVVVSCTNIRAVEVLGAIERETGVPAIASNQAALWSALVALGIDDPIAGFGSLFARPRQPDPVSGSGA